MLRRMGPALLLTTMIVATLATLATAGPALGVSGGHEVPRRLAPAWLVTIAAAGDRPLAERELCGGSLISPTRIATAAHCLDGSDPNRLEIHVGGSTLSRDPGRTVRIKGFATQPGYHVVPSPKDPDNFARSGAANDVALIELETAVRGVSLLPVGRREPSAGASVSVYGHGLTRQPSAEDPALGDAVRTGRLRTITDASCDSQLGGLVEGFSVLCAQSPRTLICPGDSGGPLVQGTVHGPRLVGITSFSGEVLGRECGAGPYPAAFADTTVLRPWLTQHRPVLAPMPLGPVAATGDHTAGSTLTCQQPAWSLAPTSLTYTWDRSEKDGDFEFFVPVPDQTGPTLTLSADLADTRILCVVRARTAGGTVELTSKPV
jgi:secreted trypsin-like serine protease